MPTYGYQCIDCKHEFSVFQAMKDDPIAICPECTGPVKRLLYPVGVVFKGSGWYINDSRKPDPAEKAEKAEKSEQGEKKADSGTDKASGTKSASDTMPSGGDTGSSGASSNSTDKAASAATVNK